MHDNFGSAWQRLWVVLKDASTLVWLECGLTMHACMELRGVVYCSQICDPTKESGFDSAHRLPPKLSLVWHEILLGTADCIRIILHGCWRSMNGN